MSEITPESAMLTARTPQQADCTERASRSSQKPQPQHSYCLFQEPWWLDIVAPDGWSEAVVRNAGGVVARMPYVVSRRYGVSMLTRPLLTPVLGPWHRATGGKSATRLRVEKDNTQALLAQLPKCHRYSINCHASLSNTLPFQWAGYSANVKYTYRFSDLSDLDGVWKRLSSNIRSDVRKAEKQVTVEHDLGAAAFYQVLEKTFQRQGRRAPFSRQRLEQIDHSLAEYERRRQFFAVDSSGRIHAVVYMVWDERSAYYLLGGGDPELRSSGASSLLLWHAIQHAADVTRAFDFEGSMIEPVERFFRAFGAEQTTYFQLTRYNSRALRTAAAWLGRAA